MKKISEIGQEMLAFQDELAASHRYQPIEPSLFTGDVRSKYIAALPDWCNTNGDPGTALYSLDGTLLCKGYNRIVIGDYGAFVEISPDQIIKTVLCVKDGQEYRLEDPRFADNVKYLWLTAKDRSDCKMYLQKKAVSYADYIPGMYYISPYEVDITP